MSPDYRMSPMELRSSMALSLILFLRMLGLFLILPVFALYAEDLGDATPTLVGLALGSYGLTQALLQIPFGMISDRLGRKPVIVAGLLIFVAGSIIAGLGDSIYTVILGRALQGAGAIAAAVIALAADLTRDNQRSKTMAMIGISVGVAISIAFVGAPILNTYIGVPGLFFMAAGLALLAIIVLLGLVPTPEKIQVSSAPGHTDNRLLNVLTNPVLLQLYIGIFVLHMLIMTTFVVLPLSLRDIAGLATAQHWHVYLPVLLISALLMMPCIIISERYNKAILIFIMAIGLLALSQFGLYGWHYTVMQITISMTLFFLAFNYLEAMLPSLISRVAPAQDKGTALGVYYTSQFIGIFLGGVTGGAIHEHYGLEDVFLFGGIIACCWLLACLLLPAPELTSRREESGSSGV